MNADNLAAYVDALIPGVIGVFITLKGYYGKPKKIDFLEREKEEKMLATFRWAGPGLVLVSLGYLLVKMFSRPG
jgi:hypothetical protein